MTRSKADHAEAIRNVTAIWPSRGYRHDFLIANLNVKDPDPSGELAYQRAFADAVKKVPPRLPNPAHYPNSPSAVTLIHKQNQDIFNARPSDAPNPRYEQPIADMYWKSKEDDHVYRSTSSTPPVINGTIQAPSTPMAYLPQPNGQTPMPSQIGTRNPPLLMEPKLGAPMGPPSKLR